MYKLRLKVTDKYEADAYLFCSDLDILTLSLSQNLKVIKETGDNVILRMKKMFRSAFFL